MKKLQKAVFIILLIALFIGAAGILAGAVLGAQPLEIGETILREAVERSNFDHPYITQLIPSPTPEPTPAEA